VKHCFRGQSFETAGELFSSMEVVLRGIGKSTLNSTFPEWMEKFDQCNGTNDDYFEDT
jgi:hypothetical protein